MKPAFFLLNRNFKIKETNKTLKNYRPMSLLPICEKVFERLMFNEMFNFFIEDQLTLPNQSGFNPDDSTLISCSLSFMKIFTGKFLQCKFRNSLDILHIYSQIYFLDFCILLLTLLFLFFIFSTTPLQLWYLLTATF